MTRTIAAVLIAFGLSACGQHDQGADLSACKLEEMKTNYTEKVRINKELQAAATADDVTYWGRELRKGRLEFLRLCMRTKGWTIDLQGLNCLQNFDQAYCYKRADSDSD